MKDKIPTEFFKLKKTCKVSNLSCPLSTVNFQLNKFPYNKKMPETKNTGIRHHLF